MCVGVVERIPPTLAQTAGEVHVAIADSVVDQMAWAGLLSLRLGFKSAEGGEEVFVGLLGAPACEAGAREAASTRALPPLGNSR